MAKEAGNNTLPGGYKAMAAGGIVTQPTKAIVGEAGPEAVLPLDSIEKRFDIIEVYLDLIQKDVHALVEMKTKEIEEENGGFFGGLFGRKKKPQEVTNAEAGSGGNSRSFLGRAASSIKQFFTGGSEPTTSALSQNPQIMAAVKKQIMFHEGMVLHPYKDSLGYPTIGVGHLIQSGDNIPSTITKEYAESLFSEDFNKHMAAAQKLPGFDKLDAVRQGALVDMVFNMGLGGVKKFTGMLGSLQKGDYAGAKNGILNSKYARQVGDRANTIASLIETGSPNKIVVSPPMVKAHTGALLTGSGEMPIMAKGGEAVISPDNPKFGELFIKMFNNSLDKAVLKEASQTPLLSKDQLTKNYISRTMSEQQAMASPISKSIEQSSDKQMAGTKAIMQTVNNVSTSNMSSNSSNPKPQSSDIDLKLDQLFSANFA
jgi:lysozyme